MSLWVVVLSHMIILSECLSREGFHITASDIDMICEYSSSVLDAEICNLMSLQMLVHFEIDAFACSHLKISIYYDSCFSENLNEVLLLVFCFLFEKTSMAFLHLQKSYQFWELPLILFTSPYSLNGTI